MRIPQMFTVFALSAASLVAANAQQPFTAAKAPTGLSLAYDAPHGQFTASGIQLLPSAKANVTAPTTGTIDVTITIKLVSKYPKGTSYPCSVIAIGGLLDLNSDTVDGGVETVNSVAPAPSGSATTVTCSVTIPYSWDLGSTSGGNTGLILAYAAAAVNAQGVTQRSTLQVSGIENLPANDTTSKFAFDAAL